MISNPVTDIEEMKLAACELANRYHCAVLVKGGHLSGNTMCDVLYNNGRFSLFEQQKIESRNLHGTGCTLSSAIAAFAARGKGLEEAVRQAKVYISKAICHGKDLHIGHGNGPLCHFFSGEINFVPLNSTEEVIRKFPHEQQAEYREENFQGETS